MTTPDSRDDAHGMDPHDSPAHDSASEPAASAVPSASPEPGGATDADGPADESAEEAALRDLLHGAVRDLRPASDALEHLRRAVPARRQHRRQALAGTAAAVLLVGAAVPALIRAAATGGSTTAAPANAASTHAARTGEDGHVDGWGTTGDSGQSDHQKDSGGQGSKAPSRGGTDGPSSVATSPGGPPPVSTPECSADQLGQGASSAASLDATGRADGWFRVANVSSTACLVPPGPAKVQLFALGTADLSQISVVSHTPGDPATELPATSDATPLVLAPGADYEVAFAWVPADAGPGGCSQPTSPPATPTPTETPTNTAPPDPDGAGAAENPMEMPNGAPTGQAADVSLRHTPAAGAPVVFGPTLQGACAGTIYTTAPVAAAVSDAPPS
ncbi:hypothetical protein [Actinacidiphila paucisporea]|uniref:DUF4232 domain-containing protein n=1 Tax=Actinacidiphila paucisporea TaxID=310782 RepID=A0A1M6ZHD5_9ACTN|nr:hypothetical protein [Actinacidiphila paucisporea]SHL29931.1 hypothetical protein SAMN05216499_103335 [Actinacidiphila paucisporea]